MNKIKQINGKKAKTKEIGGKKLYLSQIFGDKGQSRFGTVEQGEYEKQINGMNKSDLITHASKVGIIPKNDTERLRKELLKEFKKHIVNYNLPSAPKPKIRSIDQLSAVSKGLLAGAR
jgi:hypothetical protein